MKKFTKAIALLLSLILCISIPVGVSAAEVADATIDMDAKASLTVYKYDLTNAEKDGVWDSSYVSTGVYDQSVNDTLGGTNRNGDTDNKSDLGNQYVSDDKCIVDNINLIRRLTPLECERLQGFPDGWTNIPGASDSAAYKALGNSVAIPCVDYVMKGIAAVLREEKRRRQGWRVIGFLRKGNLLCHRVIRG